MVIKRDGTSVPFNEQKIIIAISKAYWGDKYQKDINPPHYAADIANYIKHIHDTSCTEFPIEEIQELVEKQLMQYDPDTARDYIRYRYKREAARKYKNDFLHSLQDKIEAKDVQNSNANVDEHSFGGRMGEVDAEVLRQYALEYCMSETSKNNHLNNRIYIHDLSHYALGDPNCLTCPIDQLLANGFKTRQTDIRPANSVNTAMQLTAVIFQLQSLCQFGGISASHYDWTLVPYVRKSFRKHFKDGMYFIEELNEHQNISDNIIDTWPSSTEMSIDSPSYMMFGKAYQYAMHMTKREVQQSTEALIHNLNSLQSRSGCQLPFTSINLGTCTLPEGRMVIEAMLNGFLDGTGPLHRTPIFPCLIFQCAKGINRAPSDKNYDLFRLALKCTSKRLYPNYANVDWSVNAGYDKNDPRTWVSTMGKRKLQLM